MDNHDYDIRYLISNLSSRENFYNIVRNNITVITATHLPYIKKRIVNYLKDHNAKLVNETKKYSSIKTNRPTWGGVREKFIDDLNVYLKSVPVFYKLKEFNEIMKNPNVKIKINDNESVGYQYTYSDMLKVLIEGENKRKKK